MARVFSKGPTTCYRGRRGVSLRIRTGRLASWVTGCGGGAGREGLCWAGTRRAGRGRGRVRSETFAVGHAPRRPLAGTGGQQPCEARRDWRRGAVIGRHAGRSLGRAGAASSWPRPEWSAVRSPAPAPPPARGGPHSPAPRRPASASGSSRPLRFAPESSAPLEQLHGDPRGLRASRRRVRPTRGRVSTT